METYDPHKSTSEVRQGSGRIMNFRVLILSLIGIILIFGVLYALWSVLQPGDRVVPLNNEAPAVSTPPASGDAPVSTPAPSP